MRSKTKIYPLAAAICYTVFGVYIAVELVEPNFRCGYYFAAFWDTLFFCGLIGLAAAHVAQRYYHRGVKIITAKQERDFPLLFDFSVLLAW